MGGTEGRREGGWEEQREGGRDGGKGRQRWKETINSNSDL